LHQNDVAAFNTGRCTKAMNKNVSVCQSIHPSQITVATLHSIDHTVNQIHCRWILKLILNWMAQWR